MTNLNQWGFVTPEAPRVPPEMSMTFLKNAPVDTVILIDDSVFKRISEDTWRDLESLVYINGEDTWEKYNISDLQWCVYETTVVRVLHMPI